MKGTFSFRNIVLSVMKKIYIFFSFFFRKKNLIIRNVDHIFLNIVFFWTGMCIIEQGVATKIICLSFIT